MKETPGAGFFSNYWKLHGVAIILTFQIFWIAVFLMDRVTGKTADGLPQFVYVNF